MSKRGKRVQSLQGVSYAPATDTFRFTLLDRTDVTHSFVCDYATFEYLANELGTRLAQVEHRRAGTDAPAPPEERIRIDVGATDDGLVRLAVHSSRNKTFEVRFNPEVTDGLIRNLERARDHVAARAGSDPNPSA